ncbi:hypothetical protein NL478_26980, partial [Klebsiella pneumoniae]|nr:hypothetical protein [Klebsiella pneumoniae]
MTLDECDLGMKSPEGLRRLRVEPNLNLCFPSEDAETILNKWCGLMVEGLTGHDVSGRNRVP